MSTPRAICIAVSLSLACGPLSGLTAAQGLTGALICTVKDAQGGVLRGAVVRVSSPALIGGADTRIANEKGQLRFLALPPGAYVLEIRFGGFAAFHEENLRIGAGHTIERTFVLDLAGRAESLVVDGAGSRIDARDSGFGTRFGLEDLKAIPSRRSSMFDLIRAAPGISPTSPTSGTVTTMSAFGSGTNENQFLFDGTNFTCPCNGIARAEPGVDFIQEIHVQSAGASAEFGNMQGAVINVIIRQGSNRFLYDAAYHGQLAGLTSGPVLLALPAPQTGQSRYERVRYRDLTTSFGGPAIRDRLWFFAGYQYLRDYDSQPGTDPAFPRIFEKDTVFAKLTSRLAPDWQLNGSFHDEFRVNPERPTLVTPLEATTRTHATVPAVTFGPLAHTLSANTVWDVRAGRFTSIQHSTPRAGLGTTPGRFDRATGFSSGAPRQFGDLTIARTTAKATVSHYRPAMLGANHLWKTGAQVERGEHHGTAIIPNGVRFVDNNGQPFQSISRDPSVEGGLFISTAAFVTDAVTVGDRLTINAGLRFDHNRAISQDLRTPDSEGRPARTIVEGLGTLYTWNVVSPRLGVTMRLGADGRTMLRASYGRFSQGVLTGELGLFHRGSTPTTTRDFVPADGDYTRIRTVVDSRNLELDPETRAPRTDEYSVALDRELGRRLAVAVAFVHKRGANFIGWSDIGGRYREETRSLPDGRSLPVFVLVNSPDARRFLLTNPDEYSLRYNGLVMVVERRRSQGWHAFGSYTWSRAYGLQPSSGTTAAGAQISTIGPPAFFTFGRDPNDLTNTLGRLPNDRPHMLRMTSSASVPRTGVVVTANLQHFSGKPWAATAQILLPQGDRRVLLEPRGSRRLASQTLLDVRVSSTIALGRVARIELLLDVLNALDDTAAEGLATDTLANPHFGQPAVFLDPRRAMLGVRLNLGR